MRSQEGKAEAFRQLHLRPGAFIAPNPWDAASARILEAIGFEALATTSAGYAFSRGQRDNVVDRGEVMASLAEMARATDLPISADLGHCFGDEPATVAETIRLAAAHGMVGCSVEDAAPGGAEAIFPLELAIERVEAAVAAARALPFPFTLTARAENFFLGRPDLEDTIRRLRAFRSAGADVVFAHGLRERHQIEAVVQAVDAPLNVLAGWKGAPFALPELAAMGVKRISVGPELFMTAMRAVLEAGEEMRTNGTFGFAADLDGFGRVLTMVRR